MINYVDVKFPGLGWTLNVNPVAFTIGSIDVYWYGLLIAAALVLSVILAVKQAKSLKFPEGLVYDTILMIIPCAIIGARAYFVACNWDYYGKNLKAIFDLRSGGLAIYGGVILVFIGGIVMCRVRKIPFMELADYCVVYLPLGQAIGRWGNFFNQEAFGRIVSKSILVKQHIPRFIINGMYISGYYREPTFLYESILSFIGFIVLNVLRITKNLKTGIITSLYLTWYGMSRLAIESLRTDSLMLGSFKIAQLISLLGIISGVIILILSIKKNNYYKEDYIYRR